MNIQTLNPVFLILLVTALPLLAQSDSIQGTWSGDWQSDSEYLDRVTLEFRIEGDGVAGRMINPTRLDFGHVSFDRGTGDLVAEAEGDEAGSYRVEASMEGTRLNGLLTHGDMKGELRLTKWTFVPRPR